MKKLSIVILLIFTACTSPIPKWYNKIYQDNQNYLYATGSGPTKKDAINSALANASAKIAIKIKSIYKSLKYQNKTENNTIYSNTSVLNIQAKTFPIIFTNYKIIKLTKIADKYYVLIKIDRYKTAKYMCKNLNIPIINTNNLNLLLKYHKIVKILNKKIEEIKNINAIYPICQSKLKKLIKLKNKIYKKFHNFTYNIKGDKRIRKILSSILKIKKSQNGTFKISVKSKIKYKRIGTSNISIINLFINVQYKNKIKSFYLTCASSSIQDYNTASMLAIQKCKEKLEKIFNN